MKRFFREVEAIWRRTLHRRSQKAGMFMPRFLRLLRRFPLAEPTILNPYRPVIQEITKNPHESRGSSGVKLYLFAGIGKKPQDRAPSPQGAPDPLSPPLRYPSAPRLFENSAEWLRVRPRVPPRKRPLPDRLPVRGVDPAH